MRHSYQLSANASSLRPRDRSMSTCRCGAWVGHPEVRTCTIPDCELRGVVPQQAATPVIPLAGAAVPQLRQQRTNNRQANLARRGDERVPVHGREVTDVAA